jgi:peroxisomal 3,2-trans-enoyl-CoA isomerase
MSDFTGERIVFETEGKVAIITLNIEKKLNALTQDLYYRLAELLREIEKRDDLYITVIIGKGRYFSAGADVTAAKAVPEGEDPRRHWLRSFVSNNLYVTRAFYEHPKILIAALNGPVVGLSASLIALSDFIYAVENAFLLTPFSSLGLVAEGGASFAFVQRMGISKANEALILSKRISAQELFHCGFINKLFPQQPDASFRASVLAYIQDRFGDHLNNDSLLGVKRLIRQSDREILDRHNRQEVFAGLERFVEGVPQKEFAKIASGQKRHKL